MARYSGGAISTGAGSTTLPLMSLYAGASTRLKLVEVGVFNTTAVAVAVKLVRLSTTGTQGSGLVEAKFDADTPAASGALVQTHSVAPTLGDDLGYRAELGAAVGAGAIWTMDTEPIRIPTGTGNGVGVIVDSGTGQVCDIYFVWDE